MKEELVPASRPPTTGLTQVLGGTFSIGFFHPDIEWIVPGIYKAESDRPEYVYAKLHNGLNAEAGVEHSVSSWTPLYVELTGARFVTLGRVTWTLIEPAPGYEAP